MWLFRQSGEVEIRGKLRQKNSHLSRRLRMTLYWAAENTNEEKGNYFETLRVPEDGRMLPTVSEEAQETMQCETCKK